MIEDADGSGWWSVTPQLEIANNVANDPKKSSERFVISHSTMEHQAAILWFLKEAARDEGAKSEREVGWVCMYEWVMDELAHWWLAHRGWKVESPLNSSRPNASSDTDDSDLYY